MMTRSRRWMEEVKRKRCPRSKKRKLWVNHSTRAWRRTRTSTASSTGQSRDGVARLQAGAAVRAACREEKSTSPRRRQGCGCAPSPPSPPSPPRAPIHEGALAGEGLEYGPTYTTGDARGTEKARG